MDVARLGNKYLADTEPWKVFKTEPEKVKTILHYSLQICANLITLGEPFIPFTAEKLRNMLAMEKVTWENTGNTNLLSAGHKMNKSGLLFEKIEDDAIQKQMDRLKREPQPVVSNIPAIKENVCFDDFTKMDIRTVTVMAAERVPKTQKLLKLTVDLGFETRTVVSGVAESVEPEHIIGKKVCLLANLAPRNIKGVESKGMILYAENSDGKFNLVNPGEGAENGSLIK